ncbi:MAG: acyl carrier protein [Propionibacterium sp.]|nr:acyl carrier protein [Propionibacterium sp.]
MTEEQFKEALAELAELPAAELTMTDTLAAAGIDSIGIFEFLMKLEDVVGDHEIEVNHDVRSLQDLYDAVLEGTNLEGTDLEGAGLENMDGAAG